MKPNLHIYKIETTEFWDEDIRARAGRLYDVYIFDSNNGVNMAELTPSYEMHYLGPTWTQNPEDDKDSSILFEQILAGTSDTETCYIHAKDVDVEKCEHLGLSDVDWQRFIEDADGDMVEAQKAVLENWSEYCRGNGYIY